MGKYKLTPSEQARFDRMWNGLSAGAKTTAVLDFDHFCSWLRGEDSSFYYSIKNKLRELWDEVKSVASDIAEGLIEGAAIAVAAPVIGAAAIAKGVWDWLNDD